MEENLSQSDVIDYYNEHVQHKLNDYIKVNPRIETAWNTMVKFAPANPLRVLEVGCGIGSICSKMHSRWPSAKITGMDISTSSIQIADKLFSNNKVSFIQGILTPELFSEQFDLILFMDVYEHIAIDDRAIVHSTLKKILKDKGRIFLSVPTPHNLKWSLKYKPETMQPVDEHITYEVIGELAKATDTEVLLYQIKNVWNTGDYAHIVLEKNSDFEASFFHSKPVTAIQRGIRIVNKIKNRLGSVLRKMYVRSRIK